MSAGRAAGRARALALAASALAVAGAGGCNAVVPRAQPCRSGDECRAAFGIGSVCGAAGYCQPPQRHPRCTRAWPENLLEQPPEMQRERIVVGTIYSYRDHQDSLRATELAIRQADADGLAGRRIGVVHCDYTPMVGDALNDIDATTEITRYLVDAVGARLVIGPRGSARAVAAFNAARAAMTADPANAAVVISPSATSPSLTALDNSSPTDEDPGLLWRTVPPDTLQGEVIARDMSTRMVARVAVAYQMGAYGEPLSQIFAQRYSAAGGAAQMFPFTSGMLGDVISQVGSGDFQEVLFISSNITDYVAFLNGTTATPALTTQYATKAFFFTDTAYNQMLLEMTTASSRPNLMRVRGTRPAPSSGDLFNAFAADYQAVYGMSANASGFTAHSYDAAWIGLYGMAWSYFNEGGGGGATGTLTAQGIARGLRRLSSGTRIDVRPASWIGVQDAMRRGAGVDARGASGELQFDPATEELTAPIEVWRVAMPGGVLGFERERIEGM